MEQSWGQVLVVGGGLGDISQSWALLSLCIHLTIQTIKSNLREETPEIHNKGRIRVMAPCLSSLRMHVIFLEFTFIMSS